MVVEEGQQGMGNSIYMQAVQPMQPSHVSAAGAGHVASGAAGAILQQVVGAGGWRDRAKAAQAAKAALEAKKVPLVVEAKPLVLVDWRSRATARRPVDAAE